MNVIILGAGNVAHVLGKRIKNSGHAVVQVFNRSIDNAKELADKLGCTYTDSLKRIIKTADIYIIAIKDSEIAVLQHYLSLGDKLVVHTAGSVNKSDLEKISSRFGVLYPLQSLRKGMNTDAEIPFLIDGSSADVTDIIEEFAATLSKKVQKADDAERLRMHVAAVVVSNFSNHLYVLANDYCKEEQLDFSLLMPLIKETAERINNFCPRDVQTGPALRNDIITLDKHLRVLAAYPKLKYIYLKMTDSIINTDK